MVRGEIPIELGDSWYTTKTIKVVRIRKQFYVQKRYPTDKDLESRKEKWVAGTGPIARAKPIPIHSTYSNQNSKLPKSFRW